MLKSEPNTDELLDAASQGDARARGQLLERFRSRLVRMVAVRLDRRLATRVDPSDLVQEAILEAVQRFDGYIRERPLPFYPWLRRLAWDRLVDTYRRHVQAGRRSVEREEAPGLSGESVLQLAERLRWSGSGPCAGLRRQEQDEEVRAALAQLAERDREVLVLRHLAGLSTAEAAEVMGISVGAVKVRLLRATQRLRDLLSAEAKDLS